MSETARGWWHLSYPLGTTLNGSDFRAWVDDDPISPSGRVGYVTYAEQDIYHVVYDPPQDAERRWSVWRNGMCRLLSEHATENEALQAAAVRVTLSSDGEYAAYLRGVRAAASTLTTYQAAAELGIGVDRVRQLVQEHGWGAGRGRMTLLTRQQVDQLRHRRRSAGRPPKAARP